MRNAVERAVVLADGGALLEPDDFSFDMTAAPSVPRRAVDTAVGSVFEEIAQAEADRIEDALRKTAGSMSRAARILGIPRTTLNDRLQRLGIT